MFEINIAERYTDVLQGRVGYAHYGLLKLPQMRSEEAVERFSEVVKAFPYPQFTCSLYEATAYRTEIRVSRDVAAFPMDGSHWDRM